MNLHILKNFLLENKLFVIVILVLIIIIYKMINKNKEQFENLNIIDDTKDKYIVRFELVNKKDIDKKGDKGSGLFLTSESDDKCSMYNKYFNNDEDSEDKSKSLIVSSHIVLKKNNKTRDDSNKNTMFNLSKNFIRASKLKSNTKEILNDNIKTLHDNELLEVNNLMSLDTDRNLIIKNSVPNNIKNINNNILVSSGVDSELSSNFIFNKVKIDEYDNKPIVSLNLYQLKNKNDKLTIKYFNRNIIKCCNKNKNKCKKYQLCDNNYRICLSNNDDEEPLLFKVHLYEFIRLPHKVNGLIFNTNYDIRLKEIVKLLVDNKIENEFIKKIIKALEKDLSNTQDITASKKNNCIRFYSGKKLKNLLNIEKNKNYSIINEKDYIQLCPKKDDIKLEKVIE